MYKFFYVLVFLNASQSISGTCLPKWRLDRTYLNYQGTEGNCPKSFKELRPYHLKALKEVLKDKPPVTGAWTGGLFVLEPNGDWNKAVMAASLKSKDWLDYRKNYPRHKSQKSSNAMIVEIIKEQKITEPFTDLFKELGLTMSLQGVEKVSSTKEPKTKTTVLVDAGSFHWTCHPSKN